MENIVEDSPFLFESSKCCLGSKRRCIPYQYSCLLIFCGFSSSDSLWSRPFCDDGTRRKTRNFSFVNEYFCSHGMDRRWDVYGIGTAQEMIRRRSSEICISMSYNWFFWQVKVEMPGVRIFFLCSFFFLKLEVRKKETGQRNASSKLHVNTAVLWSFKMLTGFFSPLSSILFQSGLQRQRENVTLGIFYSIYACQCFL